MDDPGAADYLTPGKQTFCFSERIRAERTAHKPGRSSRRRASMGVDGQT